MFYPMVTIHNATYINIKVTFDEPAKVSSAFAKDRLVISIIDFEAFQSS